MLSLELRSQKSPDTLLYVAAQPVSSLLSANRGTIADAI